MHRAWSYGQNLQHLGKNETRVLSKCTALAATVDIGTTGTYQSEQDCEQLKYEYYQIAQDLQHL